MQWDFCGAENQKGLSRGHWKWIVLPIGKEPSHLLWGGGLSPDVSHSTPLLKPGNAQQNVGGQTAMGLGSSQLGQESGWTVFARALGRRGAFF